MAGGGGMQGLLPGSPADVVEVDLVGRPPRSGWREREKPVIGHWDVEPSFRQLMLSVSLPG